MHSTITQQNRWTQQNSKISCRDITWKTRAENQDDWNKTCTSSKIGKKYVCVSSKTPKTWHNNPWQIGYHIGWERIIYENLQNFQFHQALSALAAVAAAWPRRRPVLLAAIRPTFWPGGASRRTVLACPMCWWLPPPWGCSTGLIATPRTLGQQFLFTLYLWYAFPAFSIGFSVQPPLGTIFFDPDGSLILKLSSMYEFINTKCLTYLSRLLVSV